MEDIKHENNFTVGFTYEISVKGIVQGVGFRPFIWRLATESGFAGSVCNTTEGVLVKINAPDEKHVKQFMGKIIQKKPAPALIEDISYSISNHENFKGFSIEKSIAKESSFQLVSPDLATCSKCTEEIMDKKNKRRYLYPFTNCTNCGPRFTIIEKMPYDRPNTTMKIFEMCPDCLKEYNDPLDRRFHAQPNACIICGPQVMLADKDGRIIDCNDAILEASKLLNAGKIVGIKSLGGFQIACDATNDETVTRLRYKKNRPSKPFAIMFKDIEMALSHYKLKKAEITSLKSPNAPIVLVKKIHVNKPGVKTVCPTVSGFNNYEGIMIAYTPLHHILFKNTGMPLVMTSGNISEEPISSGNDEAIKKLGHICDYFLLHDREIFSKYDDSVLKVINNKEMLMRRARGFAPYPVKIENGTGKNTILAAGAQEKNTFCLLYGNFAIMSQHIGDMDNIETADFYKKTLENYSGIFGLEKVSCIAYDSHPLYLASGIAREYAPYAKKIKVQHHEAHVASVIAENGLTGKNKGKITGFAWDGTGYGDDGKIWGSEVFTVNEELEFERVSHLTEKLLPGGEITIKNPYRMAVTYLYYLWKEDLKPDLKIHNDFESYIFGSFPDYKKIISALEMKLLAAQLRTGFNSPLTTSMGRLFDAVSSLIGLTHSATYEGEAAVHLEMSVSGNSNAHYNINIIEDKKKHIIDDIYLFRQVLGDFLKNVPAGKISLKFHNSLVKAIIIICEKLRENTGAETVALSGGVFQNTFLILKAFRELEKKGFKVYSNFKVPVNDGGISLGQAFLASKYI